MTTLSMKNSIGRSTFRRAFLLIPLSLACFALSQMARAQLSPPDGDYPGANTAEGYNALFTFISNYDPQNNYKVTANTAIGYNALFSNVSAAFDPFGSYNTATGTGALYSNTTGFANTANGVNALTSNTTGAYNTATGQGALLTNTTTSDNTHNRYAP